MTNKFEIDGKWYETDIDTIEVLRSIIPAARASGDASAVAVVMTLGLQTGRITETDMTKQDKEHKWPSMSRMQWLGIMKVR